MRTRRLTAIGAVVFAAFGTGCGGGGGPHAGAAPAVENTAQLLTKIEAAGVKCSSVSRPSRFFGDKPLPLEEADCHAGKETIEITRYRAFDGVSSALRRLRSKRVCNFAKVFHVPDVPYLYGDNWIVSPDPTTPAVTKQVTEALGAGTWTLHCSGVTPEPATTTPVPEDDPCLIVSKRDVTALFGAPAAQDKDFAGALTVGMTYCDWKAHSEHGHVPGSIDYELIVGVMDYSSIQKYSQQISFEGPRSLTGIGEKAVYAKLSDTATTAQFVKDGKLVVLNYGVGPYVTGNLDKGLSQADRLIATARAAAARMKG